MNKRIEEIAKKMDFDRDEHGMFWDQDGLNNGVDLEKFARLIVEECVKVCTEGQQEEHVMGLLYSKKIKRHFGVK